MFFRVLVAELLCCGAGVPLLDVGTRVISWCLLAVVALNVRIFETDECAVCLQRTRPRVTTLPCGHVFHLVCVSGLSRCPLCRADVA